MNPGSSDYQSDLVTAVGWAPGTLDPRCISSFIYLFRISQSWHDATVKQLSWTDAAFVRLETPAAPIHVNPVLIYDPSTAPAPVTFTGILTEIQQRLGDAPSFRRRLVDLPFGLTAPYWVEDEDFDLEYHVRHIALPKPGDWRQLCIQLARLHARPLDLRRPPWELTVIEGLDSVEGVPAGSFALSLKVHHSAIDGVEGVQLINAIHDLTPDGVRPAATTKPWRPERVPSSRRLLQRAAFSAAVHPVRAVRVIVPQVPTGIRGLVGAVRQLRGGVTAPTTRFNGRVSPHRVFEARFYDFQDIRRIKAAVRGATVNDVALAYIGGALRHYLSEHGELPAESLVAACPVSIRTPDQLQTGGNMLSMMRQELGTEIADPLERLASISTATSMDRASRKPVGAPALLKVAELLPGALVGAGARAVALLPHGGPSVVNTTVTNVPGSPVPLFFRGAKMVRSTGNGPIIHSMGLIHLVSTYAGVFSCAITADRAMVPDPAFYAQCLDRSFKQLQVAAAALEPLPSRGTRSAVRRIDAGRTSSKSGSRSAR